MANFQAVILGFIGHCFESLLSYCLFSLELMSLHKEFFCIVDHFTYLPCEYKLGEIKQIKQLEKSHQNSEIVALYQKLPKLSQAFHSHLVFCIRILISMVTLIYFDMCRFTIFRTFWIKVRTLGSNHITARASSVIEHLPML